MLDREQTLKLLAENLQFFFDCVYLYLEKEDDDEDAAVLWAIINTIVHATEKTDIVISEDDIAVIQDYMHIAWSTHKFVEYGFMQYVDGKSDKYGFPAVTMTEKQYKAMKDCFDEA